MSYLDPQSWTDVDGGGNPMDWGSRQGKLLYPAYKMISKAVDERNDALNPSAQGDSAATLARGPGKIYKGWFGPVSAPFGSYVNHTINGGDFDGLEVISMWTEIAILAAIGDSSLIPTPEIPQADWCLQQYKILNLLRWTTQEFSGVNRAVRCTRFWDDEDLCGFQTGADLPTAWANAVSSYLGHGWRLVSPANFHNEAVGQKVPSTRAFCSRNRTRAKFTIHYMNPVPLRPLMSVEVDWYAFTELGGLDIFDNEGLPLSEDRLWKFQGGDPYDSGDLATSIYPTGKEDTPPEPPNGNFSQGWRTSILRQHRQAVVKWDGPDGFVWLA